MRTVSHLTALTLTLTLTLGAPAIGQAGARYPRPNIDVPQSPATSRPAAPSVTTAGMVGTPPMRGQRWGSRVGGRWWGGANAPGGWGAYRRPVRGMVVPSYWNDPRFEVSDWATYTLPQPPVGYRWTRYYDDAILIDRGGSVYDSVSGVDWDGARAPGYAGRAYPPPPVRRDDGLGGAAIGAVAGGVAGNVIAGRGNRLGGTLIGAGVGAAAGYAIDRAEDRRRPMAPGYDDYGHRGDYPPPPPAMGRRVVTREGTTVTTTTTVGTPAGGQSGYYDGGYYYPAPTVTTVVVQGPPVTTTTTTTTTRIVRSAPRPTRVRGKLVRR